MNDDDSEIPTQTGDEWGTCMCVYDEDGLLTFVCSEHSSLVRQAEALIRERLDREFDLRLHAMFARTNLGPATGVIGNFKVQRKR